MKTGNNIKLRKRAKGTEKLYSKPWSRYHNPDKYFKRIRLKDREPDNESRS